MNPRCLAAWSAAALAVPLLSTDPLPRLLVVVVAGNVTLALARPGARLRPLGVAIGVAALLAVLLDVLLSHQGAHPLAHLPDALPVVGGPLTAESAVYGVVVALGIAAGMLAVAPLSVALEPHQLIDALPGVLHRTGTAAAAALNLLPGLGRSAVAVRDAQRMRGWRPRGPRSWAELVVPVTVTAMEDSLQLAEAMEARGYGSGRRSRFRPAPLHAADLAVLAASVAGLGLVLVARLRGGDADWTPYPTPTLPATGVLAVAGCLLLAAPLLTWRRPSSAA